LIDFVISSVRRTHTAGGGLKVRLNQLILGLGKQPNRKVGAIIAVLVVILHLGYYTFIIGGDHFEWRVYSHLPPLILLSSIYFLKALNVSAFRSTIALALIIAVSLPMPWVYHAEEKKINYLRAVDTLYITVSDKLPFFLWPLAKAQDHLQDWLTDHLVCVRWREHVLFQEDMKARYPIRSLEVPAHAGQFPVGYITTVGVAGWVFPKVAIIDGYGLNDYVIARHVSDAHRERKMAHDRYPPDNYVASYIPNVEVFRGGEVKYLSRLPEYELTKDRIKALDKYWEDKIVHGLKIPDSLAPPSVNRR
jgi:arabinofuranosyltransferase